MFRDCADCPEMVAIPGGQFMMGDRSYGHGIHRVSVPDFAIGRYEVTFDEWEACGIRRESDVRDKFVPSFYFGCEADDAGVALAFDTRMNPLGAKLNAMFSSDLGHWDVPDMTGILPEAFELVEHGLIDERSFRDFVFGNPARFYTRLNPDFFRGTRVEADVAKLLAPARRPARGRQHAKRR